MSMPQTGGRELLHRRRIECDGYRRADGLFDIEARLVDVKSYSAENGDRGRLAAGVPVHDMTLRLTIDAAMVIVEAEARMAATPYRVCGGATGSVQVLVGLRIASGWLNEARRRVGARDRCTHLFELLGPMATTAYQTLSVVRGAPADNPSRANSCYAYSSDRSLVRERWPQLYTGPSADQIVR